MAGATRTRLITKYTDSAATPALSEIRKKPNLDTSTLQSSPRQTARTASTAIFSSTDFSYSMRGTWFFPRYSSGPQLFCLVNRLENPSVNYYRKVKRLYL